MRENVLRKGRWGSWDEARAGVTLHRGDFSPRDEVHPDRTSGSRAGRHSGLSLEASLSGVALAPTVPSVPVTAPAPGLLWVVSQAKVCWPGEKKLPSPSPW